MTSHSSKFRRKGYHHGNLREALVLAAKQLILEKGPHGFTLVEAAKLAGVSPGAPYRHFKDQGSLLAEVAQRGFEAFSVELEKAWNNAEPDWKTAFKRMGRAYIEFAYQERALYRAMFEVNTDKQDMYQLGKAGEQAFEQLLTVARYIRKDSHTDEDISEQEIAFHIGSMSYGAAMMMQRNQRDRTYDPADMLERNISIYLKGLGIDL